jgi:ferritin-like metal-binding protein YciE
MKLGSLEDLYVDQLKDLLDAEKQIIKALPKMAKATSSPELQNAFQEHLEQTKGQVQRLEQIFEKSAPGGVVGPVAWELPRFRPAEVPWNGAPERVRVP